jgi:hypothetical protein
MSAEPGAPTFKQKAKHEFIDYLWISLYLALLFCALSTYSMLLLRKYEVSYLNYTFAIINALIVGKVILIGKMMHLGRKAEAKPLYQAVLYKSFVYGLLIFVFHIIEEFIKRLIHHKPFGTAFEEIKLDELITRSIVLCFAFLPLFAFMELQRVFGEKELHSLFFVPGAAAKIATPGD